MQLTVAERLALFGILPKEGNHLTLKELRLLREALVLSEAERVECGLVVEEIDGDTAIRWQVDKTVEIPISPLMAELIAKILKDLEQRSQLTDQTDALFEKFCPEIK